MNLYRRQSNPGVIQQLARYVAIPPVAKNAVLRAIQPATRRPRHPRESEKDYLVRRAAEENWRESLRPVGVMGQNEETAGLMAAGAIVIGLMALTGAAGYFAGSAMSPKKDKKSRRSWGLAGIPIGFFFGPLGLGGMGLYASRM